MKECRGYNPLATTNAARFHAEVLLRLARRALRKDPNGGPMVIRQEDWFRAFLEATGVRENETPVWAVLARRHGQDYTVEYRSERIVQYVVRGELPRIVLNVTYSWRGRENPAKEYSYADDLSTPRLRVTNNRTITYRLLDFGDMILFDDIQGLEGRPTSGSLGLLFKLIGNGRLVEFRMSVAPNGTVVARARSRKAFIEIGTTVTVQPDGRSEKGVPSDPVLRELERRVEAPHVIQYRLNPPQ